VTGKDILSENSRTNQLFFKLTSALLGLLIFLIPSNLFYVLDRQLGYFGGLRVDYLIPKLYASELIATLLICVALISRMMSFRTHWKSIGFVVVLAVIQVFSPVPTSSLWFFLELLIAAVVTTTILQLPKVVTHSNLVAYSLITTICFQSSLAIYQFIFQHSLGGYWLFGESNLLKYAGIANQTLFGVQYLLPSGTTPHPNILAGVLVGLMTLVWLRKKQVNKFFLALALTLGVIAIFLTFSISAWLSATIVALVFYKKKSWQKITKTRIIKSLWFVFLITPTLLILAQLISSNSSVGRRVSLNKEAANMFIYHPLTGVGFNGFIPSLITNTNDSALFQFAQPAHHVGWLLFSEVGLLGLIGLLLIFPRKMKAIDIDSLLLFSALFTPLLSLDHYLYTLPQGRLLIAVGLAIILETKLKKTMEL